MKIKPSQKFRVIVNGVSFYTTARQIIDGVGDQISTNAAVRNALTSMQNLANANEPVLGIGAWYDTIEVQLSVV